MKAQIDACVMGYIASSYSETDNIREHGVIKTVKSIQEGYRGCSGLKMELQVCTGLG